MIKKITTEEFNNLNNEYVVLDLYADWCGPCKMIAPWLEEISEEASLAHVSFNKVNVDEEEAVAKKFGVQAIPTVIILKNGEEIGRKIGFVPKNGLLDWISSNTK